MKKKQRRVFFTWLLSHISIFIIAALIIAGVYIMMARTIEEQICTINREILVRGKYDLESEIANLENLSVQTALDERITEAAFRDRQGVFAMISDIREIVSSLKRMNAVTPSIENIIIYLSRSQLFISAEGVEAAAEDGTAVLDGDSRNTQDCLLRIRKSVFAGTELSGLAVITISLRNEYVERYLSNLARLTGGVLIFTDGGFNNAVIGSRDIDAPFYNEALKEIRRTVSSALPVSVSVQGERYIADAVAVSLPEAELNIVALMPLEDFLARLIFIRRIALILFSTALLIGFFGTFFLTKRNYRPLQQLVTEISRRNSGTEKRAGRNGNEFDYLTDSFREVYAQKDELTALLENHGQEMRNAYYASLLRGRGRSRLYEKPIGKALCLLPPAPYVRVCLFDFEEAGEESVLILPFLLQETAVLIAGSLPDGHNSGIECMEIDGRTVLLCFSSDAKTDELLKEKAVQIHKIIQSEKNIAATCIIGKRRNGKREMHRAYAECLQGLEYRFIYGPGSIILLDRLKEDVELKAYSIDRDLEFVRHIRGGNTKEAVDIVLDLLSCGLDNGKLHLSWAKYSAYNTVGLVMKALEFPACELSGMEAELLNEAECLLREPVSSLTRQKIIALVENGCEYFQSRKKSHNSELNNKLLVFIDTNIADTNLCHTMIAGAFGMNTKYCARFFKEQNGVSINDYINASRVRRAKLLLGKEMTVKDIAEQVGYGHIVTFIRIFKRMEGVSPGKYREAHLNVSSG